MAKKVEKKKVAETIKKSAKKVAGAPKQDNREEFQAKLVVSASSTIYDAIRLMNTTMKLGGVDLAGKLTALSMAVGDSIMAMALSDNLLPKIVSESFLQSTAEYIEERMKEFEEKKEEK